MQGTEAGLHALVLGAELGPALAAKGGGEPAHLRALAGDLVAAASNVEVMARDAARARAASP